MTHTRRPHPPRPAGFTLVELLVAIGIIAILIGLTVMGVSKIRRAAYATDTSNTIMTIKNAIDSYYADFHQYPGVFPNSVLNTALGSSIKVATPATGGFELHGVTDFSTMKLTGTENLVLSLYGGMYSNSGVITYDPSRISTGAGSLNPSNPKKSLAYLSEQKLLNESWWNTTNKDGHYKDGAGEASDSIIPELVDRFPQGMPILYLRANVGAQVIAPFTDTNNNVITRFSGAGQYQLEQIIGYTGGYSTSWPNTGNADESLPPAAGSRFIGEQRYLQSGAHYALNGSNITNPANLYHGLRSINVAASITKGDPKFQYPYDAFPYFRNSSLSTSNVNPALNVDVPRQKDSFILISPGPDRIYGTEDDITSFGSVGD